VVFRQDGVHELRDDRVVVADDPREEAVAAPQFDDEVVAHFVAYRTPGVVAAGEGRFECAERGRTGRCGHRFYYDAVTRPQGFSPPPVFASSRPLVFAHRGGSKIGPENTCLALTRGMAAGADGFECDVRLAADGVPVLIHDATLDRTTGASGPVHAHTSAALATIDATCRFEPPDASWAVAAPEGLPTLERDARAVPEAYRRARDDDPRLADAVAQVIRAAGAGVCAGSFHRAVLDRLRTWRRR
jgi:glycerophosphoryl diester phosphodiesterase